MRMDIVIAYAPIYYADHSGCQHLLILRGMQIEGSFGFHYQQFLVVYIVYLTGVPNPLAIALWHSYVRFFFD